MHLDGSAITSRPSLGSWPHERTEACRPDLSNMIGYKVFFSTDRNLSGAFVVCTV
jgi:hypothetical protein